MAQIVGAKSEIKAVDSEALSEPNHTRERLPATGAAFLLLRLLLLHLRLPLLHPQLPPKAIRIEKNPKMKK